MAVEKTNFESPSKVRKVSRLLMTAAVCLAFAGCGEQKERVIRHFPSTDTLAYEALRYDPVACNMATLNYAGDWWITTNRHGNDNCMSVLDSRLRPVTGFGMIGRGPQEWLVPCFAGLQKSDADSLLYVMVRDWPEGKLYKTVVNLESEGYEVSLIKDFGISMRAIYRLGDSTYLCNGDNNRYYLLDETTGDRTFLEGWDENIHEAAENNNLFIPEIQTLESLSQDSSQVIIYGLDVPVLYLHDLNDGSLRYRICIGNNLDALMSDDRMDYFAGAYIGDGYTAAVYCNMDVRSGEVESFLMMFDRNMKLKNAYAIPPADYVTFNTDKSILACLSYVDETVYLFDLNGLP